MAAADDREETALASPTPSEPEPPSPDASRRGKAKRAAWEGTIEKLYRGWHRRVAAVEEGHHRMADRLNRRHIMLGLPVVILTTLVGTSAFASLQKGGGVEDWIKLAVGSIGVLAAIITSAQTFLGYAKRAERHRVASIRYETLRRDMAQQLALPPHARPDAEGELTSVRRRMEKYAKESPPLPQLLWKKLAEEYGIDRLPPPIE